MRAVKPSIRKAEHFALWIQETDLNEFKSEVVVNCGEIKVVGCKNLSEDIGLIKTWWL